MTHETACKPVGEDDRSGDAIAVIHRLDKMLREKGWQPSDAQVRGLARMLADRVPVAVQPNRSDLRSGVTDGA